MLKFKAYPLEQAVSSEPNIFDCASMTVYLGMVFHRRSQEICSFFVCNSPSSSPISRTSSASTATNQKVLALHSFDIRSTRSSRVYRRRRNAAKGVNERRLTYRRRSHTLNGLHLALHNTPHKPSCLSVKRPRHISME